VKRHINTILGCVLTTASVIASPVTSAGSLVEFDVTVQGQHGFSQFYVQDGRIAITQDQMDGHMFFDQKSQTITIIDHAKRSFIIMDEAKIERAVGMASSVVGAMSSAMESLKSLPEDQRAAAENFLKSMGVASPDDAAKSSVTATGNSRQVNGVRCSLYSVRRGETEVSEACIASKQDTGISAPDWATIQSMRGMWMKYADRAAPLLDRFGAGLPDMAAIEVDGLPVMVSRAGKPQMVIRSVAAAKAPKELLVIPAGYTERNLPMM